MIMDLKGFSLCTRKLIMYPDLSVTGRLFGGRLLSIIDESIAMQAMAIMGTQRIVTQKISEVNFLSPALLGDILEIWGAEFSRGRSSLTISGKVIVNREVDGEIQKVLICDCSLVFVAIGDDGCPTPWNT